MMFRDKEKLLLILKTQGDVRGRTRFQKLIFLLQNMKRTDFSYHFIPYHYGPYSHDLQVDINLLEAAGYIQVEHQPDNQYFHQLTSRGRNEAEKIIASMDYNELQGFTNRLSKYHNKPTPSLILEAKKIVGML